MMWKYLAEPDAFIQLYHDHRQALLLLEYNFVVLAKNTVILKYPRKIC